MFLWLNSGELVNDLHRADTDEAQQRAAAERADRYLAALEDGGVDGSCRTVVNRTTVNTNPSTTSPPAVMVDKRIRLCQHVS